MCTEKTLKNVYYCVSKEMNLKVLCKFSLQGWQQQFRKATVETVVFPSTFEIQTMETNQFRETKHSA